MPFFAHSCCRNLTMGGSTFVPCGPVTSDLRTPSTARRDSRSSYSGYVSKRVSRSACRSAVTSAAAQDGVSSVYGWSYKHIHTCIYIYAYMGGCIGASRHSQSSATCCCRPDSSWMRRLVELVMSFCHSLSRSRAWASASPFTAMSSSPYAKARCGCGEVGGVVVRSNNREMIMPRFLV